MSLESSGAAATPENQTSATPSKPPSATVENIKAASRDAVTAFKTFATNPVGGLQPAYAALGDAKALGAGLTFGVVSVICFLLGGYLLLPEFIRQDLFEVLGFKGVMKCLLFAVMPLACAVAGTVGLRKAFGGRGGFGSDCFIPGAALLPMSLWAIVSGILGYSNYEAILGLGVFAGCTSVAMLYFGYTRIMQLSERMATIGVPVVILLTAYVTKLLAGSVVSGAMPSMSGPAFPFTMPSNGLTAPASSGGSISGTYAATGPDGSKISLNFRSGGRVIMKVTGEGQNESEEGTYQVNGNFVTISVTGEMPMQLTRDGNVLELNLGGMSIYLQKQ